MNQTPLWPPRFWVRQSPLQRLALLTVGLAWIAAIGAAIAQQPTGTEQPPAATQQLAGEPSLAATTPAVTSDVTPAVTPAVTSDVSPAVSPAVTKKTVTVRKSIGYTTKTVDDDALAEGKTKVRTKGVAGVRTLTYEVTLTGGKETGRTLVSDVVTKKPVTKVVARGTQASTGGGCDPNYDPCVPIASDVDCAGGSGDGPAYVDGPIHVIGSDPYDLDRDGDGVACDT